MSKEKTPKKRRITIELDDQLQSELDSVKQGTSLGFPEMGKVGLIKVIREWHRTGAVVAESMPSQTAA